VATGSIYPERCGRDNREDKLERVAPKAGLSDEAVQTIRRKLLGVAT
jgi:hypothetical protein